MCITSLGHRHYRLQCIRDSAKAGVSSFHVAVAFALVRVNFFDALTVREKQRVGWRRVGLSVLLST